MAFTARTAVLPGDYLIASVRNLWSIATQRTALRLDAFRRQPEPTLFQRCLAVHIAAATATRGRTDDPPAEDG